MMFSEGSGLDLATFINSAFRSGGNDSGGGSNDGWGNGNNGFLWLLLFLMMGGRWGNWGGGSSDGSSSGGAASCCCVEKAVADARAAGLSDQVVLDAIQGNTTAISQIATTLNCGIDNVQTAICALDKGILQLSSQVGMSSQQIINSIQAGNCALTSELANCCCEMKQLVTSMNYENRIANMQQTEHLTGVMNAGFQAIGSKVDAGFRNLTDYLTTEKIDGMRQKISALENAANNANQTAAINAYVNAAVAPMANRIAELMARVPQQPVPAYPAPQYYSFGFFPPNNCGCNYGWA